MCELANKALISKNSDALYKKVSTTSINIPIKMRQAQLGKIPLFDTLKEDYEGLTTFSLNPKCQVKHILHSASMHFVGIGKLFFTDHPFKHPISECYPYHFPCAELHALDLQKGDYYILYKLYAVGEMTKSGPFGKQSCDTIEDVCKASKKALRFNKNDPHPTYGAFI